MSALQHHTNRCPLCGHGEVKPFYEDTARAYLRCTSCELVSVPPRFWLGEVAERATYDLHENDVQDQGYRKFLSRLTKPLLERLKPEQKGLDFGCGPGPALAMMMEDAGHTVDLFDPFYYNDPSVFDHTYDFICATEVVEHLRDPKRDFAALFQILKPGGFLAIMTKLVIDRGAFAKWHYIRDMTHICFYGRGTFEFLADHYHAAVEFVAKDVFFLTKRSIDTKEGRG